jgi:hypothetical protein
MNGTTESVDSSVDLHLLTTIRGLQIFHHVTESHRETLEDERRGTRAAETDEGATTNAMRDDHAS